MTYRELLKLYQTGELDEKTAAEVRRDIERQDAIGEYLFDQTEIPGLGADLPETAPAQADPAFLQLIQRSIRRAFWKLGAAVCAVVLAGALLAVFVLPHVVDAFYYDPTETVGVSREGDWETERLSLDLAVWTEAFAPGRFRDQVTIRPQGYGCYDFTVVQTTHIQGTSAAYLGGSLVRDRLTLFDPNVLRRPVGNAFVLPGGEDQGTFASREASFEAVDRLEEGAYYQGFVSLKEVMDYEAFLDWHDGLELEDWELWCALHDGTDRTYTGRIVGFYPDHGGMVLNWDREAYPRLITSGEDWDEMRTEEAAREHVTSMLHYLTDHPEFGEMMGHGLPPYEAEQLLASLETDGLRVYGFSIIARRETFEALRNDPHVNYLYTVPA